MARAAGRSRRGNRGPRAAQRRKSRVGGTTRRGACADGRIVPPRRGGAAVLAQSEHLYAARAVIKSLRHDRLAVAGRRLRGRSYRATQQLPANGAGLCLATCAIGAWMSTPRPSRSRWPSPPGAPRRPAPNRRSRGGSFHNRVFLRHQRAFLRHGWAAAGASAVFRLNTPVTNATGCPRGGLRCGSRRPSRPRVLPRRSPAR
jgi:hypothetical protein